MSDNAPSQFRWLFLGPVLCTTVLVAMSFENRQYKSEEDFAPFHARAASAIESVPLVIAPWMGQEIPLRDEERNLLKPNAYVCINFSDTRASALTDASRSVLLMIAQCKRANYMDGHYPPICYPARGYMLTEELSRDWNVNGQTVGGMEYHFERPERGRVVRTTVYNFMILPQQGIKRDMKAINASAEDYQQRYYGAAQFQVVFIGALAEPGAQSERDSIFAELIAPCGGVIRTLSEGAIAP